MADNSVFITGAADGAFEKALGDLPPWATQNTAESIEGILRKTLNLQTKALSQLVKKATAGDGSPDAKKVNDEFEKLVKNLRDENAQDPKRRKRNRDEEAEDGKRKRRWRAEKDQFDTKLFIEAAVIKSGLAIREVFENNVKTFNDLTASGINVLSGMNGAKDGFDSLRQLTAQTGVRFTELSASMQKYSSAVNSFGVGKFAKTVGMASANLAQFGFSSKESAELLGAYLSIQQNTNDVNKKTSAEANADLQKFAGNIFKLSMATGVSRAAIIANAEAISKSTEANLLSGQIGGQAAQGMTEFLSSFKDQNIARQMLRLMTDPIKPLNDTFMNLQKVGMGGFAQSFTTFSEGLKGLPADLQQEQMKEYVAAHRGELEMEKQRLALLRQAGVDGAAASLDFITGITQQADAIKTLTPEEKKQRDALMKSNEASKNLASAWEKLLSSLQGIFSPTVKMLTWFTDGLNLANKMITGFSDGLTWLSDKFSDIAMSLGLAKEKFDIAPWIGLTAIVAGLFLSFKVGGKYLKDFFGMLSGGKGAKNKPWGSSAAEAASGRRAGAGAGSGLSGIGKGIGDLGKGIGKGIGGLVRETLTGLADGLKALGNPKVLLGVLALAGTAAALWVTGKAVKEFVGLDWATMGKAGAALLGLGVIGAAVGVFAPGILLGAAALGAMGGALWIVGAAAKSIGAGLETLVKGFTGFGQIDGKNLLNVALGITALGGALIAFSAASAASSVGGVFSTLAGGFSKLFGDGTILDQLKSFAALGPGLKSVVDAINSINMDKALALGALSKVKTVSLPTPTPTTGASPLSTPKASTLNSPSQVSTKEGTSGEQSLPKDPTKALGAGIEKTAPETSINTALGFQTSILEQILLSTNNLISVNKDILKYAKVGT